MLGSPKRSALLSALVHAVVIALMVIATGIRKSDPAPPRVTFLEPIHLNRYVPHLALQHGGGGGAGHDLTPAGLGRAPRFSPKQFTPPTEVFHNYNPILAMEPTIQGNPLIQVPVLNLPIGDPNGVRGAISNGTGRKGSGIGDGEGDGDGRGKGPGIGGNEGGGLAGSSSILANFTQPSVVYKVEPEYSEDARKARLQGTVILYIEIDTNGKPRNFKVRQGLGLGLDERAIEAVRQWKFRAAMLDGKPVTSSATVEVNFHLL